MKKRILYTLDHMIPPRGGGERSAFTLVERLAKDFDVTILTPHVENIKKIEKEYQLIGIKRPFYFKFLKSFFKINIQNLWWHRVLAKIIKEKDFDLVISRGTLISSTMDLPIKKVIFIGGAGFFAPNVNFVNPKKCKVNFFRYLPLIFKIQYPLITYYRRKCIESIKRAEMVVSITNYIRDLTFFYTKKDSFLLNSEIKIKDYLTKKDKKADNILFIAPTLYKGVDTMYEIAKRLPEKNFFVLGNSDIFSRRIYFSLTNLPNVKSFGKISDMRKIHKKVYLLVNPSKCYEGFGRTPAEAMVNGIPSVVSGFGGLPEVVGNSGDLIKDIFDVDQWVEKIKKYDSKEYYIKKSRLCKKRLIYLQKTNLVQYKKIKKEINKILKIK